MLPVPSSPTTHSNAALIRRMLALGWRYRWGCIRLLVLQGLLLVTALGALQLSGVGIDVVLFHAGNTDRLPQYPFGIGPPESWSPLWQIACIALAILAFALLRGGLNYWYAIEAGHLIHRRIVVDLRAQVYDKMQRLSFRFFDANATGSIINRVTSDVQSVRAFVDGVIIQMVILVLSLVCYLIYMLNIHVGVTLACLATTPILWIVTALFSRLVRPAYDRVRDLVDRVILTLAENIQGVHVVKGFGREPEEIAKFGYAIAAVEEQQREIFWRVSVFTPLIGMLTQINLVVLLAYGGYLVTQDQLPLGTGLVVLAGLLQQFASQVANLTNITNSIQQSLSGARRVFEVLDAPIEITTPPNAVRLSRARGDVRFEHVSFGYSPENSAAVPAMTTSTRVPGSDHREGPETSHCALMPSAETKRHLVLEDISFHAAPGQCIAILGATGAGKSTLLSLVPRFYDPTAGRIVLDGADLCKHFVDDLRRNIGLVFQESFLFSHTVAANIAFGHPHASRDEIERAARIACAHEFIARLPDGYDTVLGEGGMDLSGGQRQRLAIARALLLDPAILLLDDPVASIDPRTEHEILDAIQSAMRGRTTFIVGHRLSALRWADFVIVLEDGKITQSGRHEELVTHPGHYRSTAELQGVT